VRLRKGTGVFVCFWPFADFSFRPQADVCRFESCRRYQRRGAYDACHDQPASEPVDAATTSVESMSIVMVHPEVPRNSNGTGLGPRL
jgi:hypothetical protein